MFSLSRSNLILSYQGYVAKIMFEGGTEGIEVCNRTIYDQGEINERIVHHDLVCSIAAQVGTVIAIAVEDEDDIAAFADYTGPEAEAQADAPPASPPAEETTTTTTESAAPASDATPAASGLFATSMCVDVHACVYRVCAYMWGAGERLLSSPAARKIANDHGIDSGCHCCQCCLVLRCPEAHITTAIHA